MIEVDKRSIIVGRNRNLSQEETKSNRRILDLLVFVVSLCDHVLSVLNCRFLQSDIRCDHRQMRFHCLIFHGDHFLFQFGYYMEMIFPMVPANLTISLPIKSRTFRQLYMTEYVQRNTDHIALLLTYRLVYSPLGSTTIVSIVLASNVITDYPGLVEYIGHEFDLFPIKTPPELVCSELVCSESHIGQILHLIHVQ